MIDIVSVVGWGKKWPFRLTIVVCCCIAQPQLVYSITRRKEVMYLSQTVCYNHLSNAKKALQLSTAISC